jgi:amidase
MGADGWVIKIALSGAGPRVAVKDAIDVSGLPTLVGSPAVAQIAQAAQRDAGCVAAVRAAGGVVVGKTAGTELCWFANGLNVHEPPPVNPLDPTRVPGGSSSGSAVVVARGEVEVALGTDTGGSIRIPAACCGIAGLKTTWGRIPLNGVWPLAPSLDTVGPLAKDIAGLELGMQLLDPSYEPVEIARPSVVRLIPPVQVDPLVDAAIDSALGAVGWPGRPLPAPWFDDASPIATIVLTGEGARANQHLREHEELLSPQVRENIRTGLSIPDAELAAARSKMPIFRQRVLEELDRADADAAALPTLAFLPPPIEDSAGTTFLTGAANVAGLPALSMPVPVPGSHLPASIQLIGRPGGEATLLALGAQLERAVGSVVV